MNKLFLILMFIVLLFSCTPNKNQRIKSIKYSACTWHLGADSVELYLADYLEINKTKQYILMKRGSFMNKPQYFTGYINDALLNFIDTVLENKSYFESYLFESSDLKIYDGFYYFLDITLENGQRKYILFVPSKSPIQIQDLSSNLDTLIAHASETIKEFDIENYKTQLQNIAEKKGLKMPQLKPLPPVKIIRKNSSG